MTLVVGYEPHRCHPPRHRPKAEWQRVSPPRAMVAPKDRDRAKPMLVPTAYPAGTLWRCQCGRGWRNVLTPPPRYGYTPGGATHWVPVQWWQWRLRKRLREADLAAMALDPSAWSQARIDEIVQSQQAAEDDQHGRY